MKVNTMIRKSVLVAKGMKTTAHKYDHASRVRNWALKIGRDENLSEEELKILELAGLWHDVGLDHVSNRSKHAEKSVDMFRDTFLGIKDISESLIDTVSLLIQYHDKFDQLNHAEISKDNYLLLRILIDADTLELLGEVGYKRGLEATTEKGWPLVNENTPLGETYGYNASDFTLRMARYKSGEIKSFIEENFVGQLNFQISCADLLYTSLAKSTGSHGKNFLKRKIMEIVNIS